MQAGTVLTPVGSIVSRVNDALNAGGDAVRAAANGAANAVVGAANSAANSVVTATNTVANAVVGNNANANALLAPPPNNRNNANYRNKGPAIENAQPPGIQEALWRWAAIVAVVAVIVATGVAAVAALRWWLARRGSSSSSISNTDSSGDNDDSDSVNPTSATAYSPAGWCYVGSDGTQRRCAGVPLPEACPSQVFSTQSACEAPVANAAPADAATSWLASWSSAADTVLGAASSNADPGLGSGYGSDPGSDPGSDSDSASASGSGTGSGSGSPYTNSTSSSSASATSHRAPVRGTSGAPAPPKQEGGSKG